MNEARKFATGDDSVFCNLCEPPYETSAAMLLCHLVRVHEWGEEEIAQIADADVIVEPDGD